MILIYYNQGLNPSTGRYYGNIELPRYALKYRSSYCEYHLDFGLDETDDIAQVNKFIAENFVPMNEGYPMLLCGNTIAYFTAKLNSARGKKSYKFCIYPTVYDVHNHRKDKQADYVIVKIHNKRTIAVIELKLLVSASITAANKDHIAQLIYEAYSVCMQEGTDYENLLCIYASHDMWHFFLIPVYSCTWSCACADVLTCVHKFSIEKMAEVLLEKKNTKPVIWQYFGL